MNVEKYLQQLNKWAKEDKKRQEDAKREQNNSIDHL